MSGTATRARIIDALRQVVDPELGLNIVDLGLIYGVRVDDDGVAHIELTMTTPGCPVQGYVEDAIRQELAALGLAGVTIEVVWSPAWSPDFMSTAARVLLGLPSSRR